MNIPLTPIEATGWTVSTILLILAIWFFYSFIIYPKQHEKNKAKQARADEEKSRREADENLPFHPPFNKRKEWSYENYFTAN